MPLDSDEREDTDSVRKFLSDIGRKGGEVHTAEHMAELGRKSAEARRLKREAEELADPDDQC